MEIIKAENLKFSYTEGGRAILDDVSLEVQKGERLVIAGLSGCGKTTLCYALMGIIPKSLKGEFSGSVTVEGVNLSELSLAESAQKIGMVFQNPDDQLVCTTVEDEVAFGLENLCVEPSEIRRRVDLELEAAGINHLRMRNPSDLSGGQKKLVTIVSVMALEPEIVIMDEPMTGLDEEARKLVHRAVARLHEMGKTVIVIEHDLSLVDYADRIISLKDGKLSSLGVDL